MIAISLLIQNIKIAAQIRPDHLQVQTLAADQQVHGLESLPTIP